MSRGGAEDGLLLRRATVEDAPTLHANCFSGSSLEALTQALKSDLAAQEVGERVRLVALVGGVVVGNATLMRSNHVLERHIGSVHDVIVCGTFRGRGIARRLFERAEIEARALGLELLETSVRAGTPAEQVYIRLGFKEYGCLPGGIREPWDGGQVYDHVFFWKALG